MSTRSKLSDLESRLLAADEPKFGFAWSEFDEFSYISDSNVSDADISELISLVELWTEYEQLDALGDATGQEDFGDLPIHACRALGEMRAVKAIAPFLRIYETVDDDWGKEDIPRALSLIGEVAVPTLIAYVRNEENSISERSGIIECLTNIGNSSIRPCCDEVRSEIAEFLVEQLRIVVEEALPIDDICEEHDFEFIVFNSQLLCGLVELRVTEAAALIERAFSQNQFDCGVVGDWNYVRDTLGVEELGLPMPEQPIDFAADDRRRMGVGVFSEKPFLRYGEPDWDDVAKYVEKAIIEFEDSAEGRQVVETYGTTGWLSTFLEMGITYLGSTVDLMKVDDAEEIIFSIFPRKVSVDADSAEEIVLGLRKFWEFLGRNYGLKNAGAILELFSGQAVDRLKRELSDSRNFGMAKSMFMQGSTAGFDMTSQEGMNEFFSAYNASLPDSRMDAGGDAVPGRPVFQPTMTAEQRKSLRKKRKKQLARHKKKRRK